MATLDVTQKTEEAVEKGTNTVSFFDLRRSVERLFNNLRVHSAAYERSKRVFQQSQMIVEWQMPSFVC
jgi:hypothetical protein